MKIAYFTPLNPIKSGISDFAEELLIPLSKSVDIVLFVDNLTPTNTDISYLDCYDISAYDSMRDMFDLAVYQVGNSAPCHERIVEAFLKYGGILEMHDIAMHHYLAETTFARGDTEKYLQIMTQCHADAGRKKAEAFLNGLEPAPWESDPMRFTVTRHLIERADSIIVHSDMAKQMVLGVRPDIPIISIPLHSESEENVYAHKVECRKKLNIPEDMLVFGSFGFATRTKRILPILSAIKKYRDNTKQNFLYLIVGEASKELKLPEILKEYGLEECVRVTGFTELEDFKAYLGSCDFCLNLRYPTQGESSASLHRMLGMGKPAVLTDIGTFCEYPDEVALKVRYDENEVEDIYQAIFRLGTNPAELTARSQAALAFAREYCDIEKNAKKYAQFLHEVKAGIWQPNYLDSMIGRLIETGLTDEQYLLNFYKNLGESLILEI